MKNKKTFFHFSKPRNSICTIITRLCRSSLKELKMLSSLYPNLIIRSTRGLSRLALLCLTISSIAVSASGCGSYKTPRGGASPGPGVLLANNNPRLLFNLPSAVKPAEKISDYKSYIRADWPISHQPYGYVSAGEIITYQEYVFDEQYLRDNDTPRVRFHKRFQGYRLGQMYR